MKAEHVVLTGDTGDRAKVDHAAHVLAAGGLVAFATETVYGIGCMVSPEGFQRLDEAKGRPGDKRYTLHIADPADAGKFVPLGDPRVRKLVNKAWPGPLTIVFEVDTSSQARLRARWGDKIFPLLYEEGTVGLRCPDNAAAGALLRAAVGPVVAPSANLSGQAPATTAAEVLAQLDGRIDMVLDSDAWAPCRHKASSTVVRLGRGAPTTLRQGVVSIEQVIDAWTVRVLFVCTGNTCRSPMAAGLCRKILSETLHCRLDEVEAMGYKIESAGTAGWGGAPASTEAVAVCGEYGVDIADHRSTSVSAEQLRRSDYVVVMGHGHRERVAQLCPEAAGECLLLDPQADIPDPIGQSVDEYRRCAEQIAAALKKRIDEIWHEGGGSK